MSSLLLCLLLGLLPGDLEGAERALADGEPQRALDLLADLPDTEGAPQRALVVAGRAYLALREYEAAVDPLLRASDGAPEDKQLARDAAWACWGSAQGNFARAYLEDARRYAERSGDQLLLADLLFELGDFGAALAAYRKIPMEAHERRSHLLSRVADCLTRAGPPAEAREAYRAVLDDAIEREDLATAYRAAQPAAANGRLIAWLDQRLAKDPEDTWARLYRGYARARSLLLEEAIEDLRAVSAVRPDDRGVGIRLAQVLMVLGTGDQKPEALREAEKLAVALLKTDESDAAAWELVKGLTWYAWVNREVERSYTLLRFLNGIDPLDRDVGLNFGAMARRLGHYEEARSAYGRLLEEDPGDPAVLTDLGILEDGLGNRSEAVRLWNRVLEEDPFDLNALENLFTHAWEQGDSARMKEFQERGLAAAERRGKRKLIDRWLWFRDRSGWAAVGWKP